MKKPEPVPGLRISSGSSITLDFLRDDPTVKETDT